MADSPNSTPVPAVSIMDLEGPILLARNSAKVLEIVLEGLLKETHPRPSHPGLVELLLERDQVEALRHAMMNVLTDLGEVHETWKTAFCEKIHRN